MIYLSTENSRLAADINRLEAELGRMSIEDTNRIHLVEVERPEIPPEVAAHVARVWQFRCYLPLGYDFMEMSGNGRVSEEGIYLSGGSSSSWRSPLSQAIHQLLTISVQKKNDHVEMFYSIGGSGGTTMWSGVKPDRLAAMQTQKLVRSNLGPRSFDQHTILPLLKIYDPNTSEIEEIHGESLTTFAGGFVLFCPKSRRSVLRELCDGNTPKDFDPSWLATEAKDE